jgi:hypothetical protein
MGNALSLGLFVVELGDEELTVDESRYQRRRRIATAPDIRQSGKTRVVVVRQGRGKVNCPLLYSVLQLISSHSQPGATHATKINDLILILLSTS